MATPGKLTKKEAKRHVPAKTSLNTPFKLKWKSLPQTDLCKIQKVLGRKMESMGLQKKETRVFRKFRQRKNKPPATQERAPLPNPDIPVQDSLKNGWTDITARRQLAIGINEVTKALERNELRLVLVCKSVKPQHMTDHLITLSASRQVPACQVHRLSGIVSQPLRLKSVLALGFRHCDSTEDDLFSDVVDIIIPRVPSLDVAWLKGTEPSETSEQLLERKESTGDKKAHKRKLGDESEIIESESGDTGPVFCTLQPLQVKKVIPNPKKFKIKKKKKC